MYKNRSLAGLLFQHKSIVIFTIVSIMAVIVSYLFSTNNDLVIIIQDQETGVEYVKSKIIPEDVLTIQWEHSVEKTIWQEKLQIDQEGSIILTETRFRSFGAGVPFKKDGYTTIEDGFVVMKGLEEEKEEYQWIHSQKAQFKIFINGETLLHPTDIPHHHKAEIIIKKG
ncbi:MAG TPA: DUF1850 domain-containing protein [Pseudogracilibacillus sp.]|nr:DUF1850 domain-containing protein [Pseudogracilibacillus sp.]